MVHNEYNEQAALINPDRKIEVYRNLHKDCWSVRQGGLVKFHCHEVNMRDCDFIVQQAGHARVISEKRKNVHAFVRGNLVNSESKRIGKCFALNNSEIESLRWLYTWNPHWERVTYNPYKYETFVYSESKEPIYNSDRVIVDGRSVWVVKKVKKTS